MNSINCGDIEEGEGGSKGCVRATEGVSDNVLWTGDVVKGGVEFFKENFPTKYSLSGERR